MRSIYGNLPEKHQEWVSIFELGLLNQIPRKELDPRTGSLETAQLWAALLADLRRSHEWIVVQIVQVVLLIESVAFHRRIVLVLLLRIVFVLFVLDGLRFVLLLLLLVFLRVRLIVVVLEDLIPRQQSAQVGELFNVHRYEWKQLTGLFVREQTVFVALRARSSHETRQCSFHVSLLTAGLLANRFVLGDRLFVCVRSDVRVCI